MKKKKKNVKRADCRESTSTEKELSKTLIMFERKIGEYEAELSRTKAESNQLMDAIFTKHQVVLHRTDVDEEHLPHEQEEEPQSPHIHVEEEGKRRTHSSYTSKMKRRTH
ncbi:uncharacterized protein LOC133664577 isoform X4 [Entelurus aequoreus]|uniref:uncharacterized protein LOC133664577 isoform X4 n=1 Tax=Entelurus aequoreus TaxID=161455 RepID=UPI002B1D9CDC|nr:uncharacterized protein LOC133664577 isoform X4 [Entelurus aequoreus]